jgi:hypothetical protein
MAELHRRLLDAHRGLAASHGSATA